MEEKQINVAVISAGNRSQSVVKQLLNAAEGNVKIVSLYDPDRSEMEYFCN